MANATNRVRVILNPTAAAGAAMHKVTELEACLRRYELPHEIVLTRAPGHATELARAAAADGVDVIAVMGGDGTLNEVVQAYVSSDGAAIAGPNLALIPAGTGGDFKRTLGMSGALDEAIARIRHGGKMPVDLGVLRFKGHDNRDRLRAFINVAGFGMAGEVDTLVNRGTKLRGLGRVSFFLASVRALATYKNARVRIRVDGALWYEGAIVNVAIANGRFHGGGMMVAPHANLSDGRFEVVVLGDMSKREVLALTPKIYRGAHLTAHGIRVTSGARIEAESVFPWADVLMDVDGEELGKLPLEVTMLPGAVCFRG